MKHIKQFENLENPKNSILGCKEGDIVVFNCNYNINPLLMGNKYIIDKIYDIFGEQILSEVNCEDDYITLLDLKGNIITFGVNYDCKQDRKIRSHYFTTEFQMDINKYNL